jgi:ketosteroid isomerase-like protein
MRISIRIIPALIPVVLLLAACTGARKPSSPEPMIVDHPIHTSSVVSTMMREREADALQDSAIIRVVRARVDEWNHGNLDAFLAMYDPGAEYVVGSRYLNARDAIRRIHTARWFRGGDTARARLSANLLGTGTAGDGARRVQISWTVTNGAGGEETWTSSLLFRSLPEGGWRVIHELSPLGETAGEVSGIR